MPLQTRSFSQGLLRDFRNAGPGILYGGPAVTYTPAEFQTGLVMGRFAQLLQIADDDGKDVATLAPLDADATANPTPLIAGVVRKHTSSTTEGVNLIERESITNIEYVVSGTIAVQTIRTDTPEYGDKVYVSRDGTNETLGEATTEATTGSGSSLVTNIEVNAYFLEKIVDEVWLIKLSLLA